jgi:hypothetical protein
MPYGVMADGVMVKQGMVADASMPKAAVLKRVNSAVDSIGGAKPAEIKIRKEFPESWIYDVIEDLGFVLILRVDFFENFFVCFLSAQFSP